MDETKVLGRRVVAYLFDYIAFFAIAFGVFMAIAKEEGEVTAAVTSGDLALDATVYGNFEIGDHTYSIYGGTAAAYFFVVLAAGFMYFVVLPGIKGFTVGKLLTGIRVVNKDGSPRIGIGRSFLRGFLWIADSFPFGPLTGFVVALINKDRRRIGDMAASTLVVKAEAVGNLQPTGLQSAPPPPLAPEFQGGTATNWPQ